MSRLSMVFIDDDATLEAKLNKINEVLDYIKERLTELEEEKEELSQYQTLDSSRRSLEYTIYMREQVETNEKLEQVETQRRRDLTNSDNKRQEYLDNDKNMTVSGIKTVQRNDGINDPNHLELGIICA